MQYKSEILKVLHQDAIADYEVGGIDAARMRYYDEMCLVREREDETTAMLESSLEIDRISPAVV